MTMAQSGLALGFFERSGGINANEVVPKPILSGFVSTIYD